MVISVFFSSFLSFLCAPRPDLPTGRFANLHISHDASGVLILSAMTEEAEEKVMEGAERCWAGVCYSAADETTAGFFTVNGLFCPDSSFSSVVAFLSSSSAFLLSVNPSCGRKRAGEAVF